MHVILNAIKYRAVVMVILSIATILIIVFCTQSWGTSIPFLQLGLPIRCTLGKDCFILQYPDRDPGPGAIDFGCGRMTYDQHTGTDFSISDEQVMAQGVVVQAVAAGKVLRIRDGVADQRITNPEQKAQVNQRECGNGVVIDHDKGWETKYCHLRNGSLVVKPGQNVREGQTLGLVGESGLASFPHVHLTVSFQNQVVDPFVGLNAKPGCRGDFKPLWKTPLAYTPTGLVRAGFAPQPPTLDQLWSGAYMSNTQSKDTSTLVFWVQAYGVLQGDEESIQLFSPTGKVVAEQRRIVKAPKRIALTFVGKQFPGQAFQSGEWRGKYQLRRQQRTMISVERTILQ